MKETPIAWMLEDGLTRAVLYHVAAQDGWTLTTWELSVQGESLGTPNGRLALPAELDSNEARQRGAAVVEALEARRAVAESAEAHLAAVLELAQQTAVQPVLDPVPADVLPPGEQEWTVVPHAAGEHWDRKDHPAPVLVMDRPFWPVESGPVESGPVESGPTPVPTRVDDTREMDLRAMVLEPPLPPVEPSTRTFADIVFGKDDDGTATGSAGDGERSDRRTRRPRHPGQAV